MEGSHIFFLGDSRIQYLYHAFIRVLNHAHDNILGKQLHYTDEKRRILVVWLKNVITVMSSGIFCLYFSCYYDKYHKTSILCHLSLTLLRLFFIALARDMDILFEYLLNTVLRVTFHSLSIWHHEISTMDTAHGVLGYVLLYMTLAHVSRSQDKRSLSWSPLSNLKHTFYIITSWPTFQLHRISWCCRINLQLQSWNIQFTPHYVINEDLICIPSR